MTDGEKEVDDLYFIGRLISPQKSPAIGMVIRNLSKKPQTKTDLQNATGLTTSSTTIALSKLRWFGVIGKRVRKNTNRQIEYFLTPLHFQRRLEELLVIPLEDLINGDSNEG